MRTMTVERAVETSSCKILEGQYEITSWETTIIGGGLGGLGGGKGGGAISTTTFVISGNISDFLLNELLSLFMRYSLWFNEDINPPLP